MNTRLDKLEKRIRPKRAAAPLRVIVHRPGELEPEDAESPDVLIIHVVPVSKEAPAIEPEPLDEELPEAIAELEARLKAKGKGKP